jgi:hypothetical protein
MKEYHDTEHASMRLTGSTVMLDGKPVYITDVSDGRSKGNFRIDYITCSSDGERRYTGSVPKQEVTTKDLKLGLINDSERSYSALYSARFPARMWKEGLSGNNFYLKPISKDVRLPSKNRILCSKALYDTINGIYPDYDEAKSILKKDDDRRSVAFDRYFALNRDNELIFKDGIVVGLANKEPILKDNFFFLKEMLQKGMN